jgi:hypothetical protein
MSNDLDHIKKLAGLNEMDGPPPADPYSIAGNLVQNAEVLQNMLQGGKGNPMGVIETMENGLAALKRHFASAPR